jgi:predicted nuclease with TOPRIM domain
MNNISIFDRTRYNKKTIETFEILAAYFVDIYYNHLYIEGKNLWTNKNSPNITEGYKHALNAFLQGIENPKLYKKTLTAIHTYFESSGYISITFTNCIERITEEFIPKDFQESVTKQQKISILRKVILDANKEFIEKLVKKFLSSVIDNHNDVDNARILQDEFIDILILQRENIYHLFISAQTKTSHGGGVSAIAFDKMRQEIKSLINERLTLNKIIIGLKKIIIKKDNEVKEALENSKELFDINAKLEYELQQLQENYNDLLEKYENMQNAGGSSSQNLPSITDNNVSNIGESSNMSSSNIVHNLKQDIKNNNSDDKYNWQSGGGAQRQLNFDFLDNIGNDKDDDQDKKENLLDYENIMNDGDLSNNIFADISDTAKDLKEDFNEILNVNADNHTTLNIDDFGL